MNFSHCTRFKAITKASCLLSIALTPCAAVAQDSSSQNDAGAALGNLFKSFVQAVQRAGGNAGKEQAQAAPQGAQSPVVSQPVTPSSAALDYYIAIYKNTDAAEIRNYVSKITSPTKVLKWSDTNDFIVALGPYDSEASIKRVIDILSSRNAELNASTLPIFVFRRGTPDSQLVTSQSAQNALRFDPAALTASAPQRSETVPVVQPVSPPPARPAQPVESVKARTARLAKEAEQARQAKRQEAADNAAAALARAKYAREFPYTAVISCGMNGWDNINVLACFASSTHGAETELELRNGGQYGMYKPYEINGKFQQTNRGMEIPLSRNFSIKIQNSHNVLKLGLRIYDINGRIVFQKQVSQYQVIFSGNR